LQSPCAALSRAGRNRKKLEAWHPKAGARSLNAKILTTKATEATKKQDGFFIVPILRPLRPSVQTFRVFRVFRGKNPREKRRS
jgi:hypothetical protein